MGMKRAAVLVVFFTAVIGGLLLKIGSMEPTEVVMLEKVAESIDGGTLAELLPGKVVVMAALAYFDHVEEGLADNDPKGFARNVWGEVFGGHLAKALGGRERVYRARYMALSTSDPAWYSKEYHIPMKAVGLIKRIRGVLLERLKDHLRTPDNLREFYRERKADFLAGIRNIPGGKARARSLLLGVIEEMNVAGTDPMGPNGYVQEFTMRRYRDGGTALVATYVEIMKDLLESL